MSFSEITDVPNELHMDRDTACKISGSVVILPIILFQYKTKTQNYSAAFMLGLNHKQISIIFPFFSTSLHFATLSSHITQHKAQDSKVL